MVWMWLESFDKRKSYTRDHYTLCAVSYPATETAECTFLIGFMVLVFLFLKQWTTALCITAAPSESRLWRFSANHRTGFTEEMRMRIASN